jgi:tetratricopeptide (TPR) repeat protein
VIATEHDDQVSHFAMAVETAARIDPDTGRSLLVGGTLLTDSLSVDQFGTLLGLTQPKDRRDPLAFEHLGLRSALYFRLGYHREAKDGYKSAYRLAIQQRRPAQIITAGAMVLFLEIEDGQLGEAAAWVDYLQNARNADTKSLLFCNAKATYLWNMNRLDEAVAQMRQAIRRIPSEDRATRLHFWTNFAVLCAEANELESCQDALAEARSLGIPGLDIFRLVTLDLAEATYLMAVKRTDEAIALLESNRAICAQRGHEPADWYSVEAKAEALAIAGRVTEAKRLWSQIQAIRLGHCTRLTPRHMARRARIMHSG